MTPSTSAAPVGLSASQRATIAGLSEKRIGEAVLAVDLARDLRNVLLALPLALVVAGGVVIIAMHPAVGTVVVMAALGAMPVSVIVAPRLARKFLRTELESLGVDASLEPELVGKLRGISLNSGQKRQRAAARLIAASNEKT